MQDANINDSKRVQIIGQAGADEFIFPTSSSPNRKLAEGSDKWWAEAAKTVGYFAGHMAWHLAAEGVLPQVVTTLGDDSVGADILKALAACGVEVQASIIHGRPSPCSHIVVENGTRRVLRTKGSASEAWTEDLFPWDGILGESIDWLAVGHMPADWDGSITRRLIESAVEVGIPVSWTPGETQLLLGAEAFAAALKQISLLVVTRDEACAFCRLAPDASVQDAVLSLAARVGDQTVVAVTNHGKTPALAYDATTRESHVVPLPDVSVVDATGAGDGFHAGTAAGLVRGLSLVEALELGRKRAAVACGLWGSALRVSGRIQHLAVPLSQHAFARA